MAALLLANEAGCQDKPSLGVRVGIGRYTVHTERLWFRFAVLLFRITSIVIIDLVDFHTGRVMWAIPARSDPTAQKARRRFVGQTARLAARPRYRELGRRDRCPSGVLPRHRLSGQR